jgi:DNA-binding transcriptional ArsR family regulator
MSVLSRAQDQKLPRELLELMADRFKILGEPARLQLLDALRTGEKTVAELVSETGLRQANVSKHLQLLYRAGFVSRRKSGLNVYYRLADEGVLQLCDILCRRLKGELNRRRQIIETAWPPQK